MIQPESPSFTDVYAALETARVVDFVRYVGRRTRERPDVAAMTFVDGWNLMLGEYGELAARPVDDDAA